MVFRGLPRAAGNFFLRLHENMARIGAGLRRPCKPSGSAAMVEQLIHAECPAHFACMSCSTIGSAFCVYELLYHCRYREPK